ncbi:MAG: 4-hydroxy-tetrahydrodipicolinate synthase [Thermodesulfobacteriota bacterium]
MLTGCFTAIITPFTAKYSAVDFEGLEKLVEYQVVNGISGILAVGTTGESPTLSWEEHNKVIHAVALQTRNKCSCIAGTGSNNTEEAIEGSKHSADLGVDAVLLVDPYYNGPSSLEIRKEYVGPVARAVPEVQVIPYVIPGRTGAQLLPEDLALLFRDYKNVSIVKEATGDIENMKRTRKCCGPDYTILSGDDGMTYEMMINPEINAAGVISVISNIVPGSLSKLVRLLQEGNRDEARVLLKSLEPLFDLVTVKTMEKTPHGEVLCRARNPLAIKTLMKLLGMPSGKCRPPIGKMTRAGLEKVLQTARKVQAESPEIFKPLADFFEVDIDERLNTPAFQEGLYYEGYQ